MSGAPGETHHRHALAQIATLEQLLEVYERTVIEQSARLYQEQESLRLQRNLLRSQGEASLDGILSVDREGTILFRNRRFSEIWRIESSGALRESYDDLLHRMARGAGESFAAFARGASVAEHEERRDEVALADGRVLERYTAPIVDEGDDALLGRVWQFRDVTESKRSARLKDEFIASVSHELRTPLTSIRGALDLMAAGVTGEVSCEGLSLVKTARTNCERLSRLIDEVLDIERIEAGRMMLRIQPLRLESVVERAIDAMRPYGRELRVAFELECAAPEGLVCADTDRMTQVMENLLSNAAKHSPPRSTVHVDVRREGSCLRVAVIDRGSGIPTDLQRRIFERFTQLGSPGAARRPGTGLGLSITRAIIEHHRGTIDFASEPGKGSTFFFCLPEYRAGSEGETA